MVEAKYVIEMWGSEGRKFIRATKSTVSDWLESAIKAAEFFCRQEGCTKVQILDEDAGKAVVTYTRATPSCKWQKKSINR